MCRLALLGFLALSIAFTRVHAAPMDVGAAPPPIETFFQNPAFHAAELSPSGKSVAMLFSGPGGRVQLAVLDLAAGKPTIVAGFADADIRRFDWVNERRLVFDVKDLNAGMGVVNDGPGLYAVNRDGSDFRTLVRRSTAIVRGLEIRESLPANTLLHSTIHGIETDNVYVIQPRYSLRGEPESMPLLRLNTVTGKTEAVSQPGNSRFWLIDQSGAPRAVRTRNNDVDTVYFRDADSTTWRKLAEFNMYKGFLPFEIGPDNSLYVLAQTPRHGKMSLYRYDLATNKLADEPLISVVDYDFTGRLVTNRAGVLGARTTTDAETTIWFDARLKAVQEKVDALLPGTINRISVPAEPLATSLLVLAFSDREPGTYLLYNTESGALEPLGKAYPDVEASRMGTKDMVRYAARDGLVIPAYLTVPHGAAHKNLPMVVLVHGGPSVRGGTWKWDAEAQFLASRGYAVLEPEFRGSTGFGFHHFEAGWKQWGLAMQDDLADGARWAIAQQIADPKRICIAGASYGGYATLMGLINDPDLFRCGVAWLAVTDIDYLYTIGWSDSSVEWQTYGMPRIVGDRQQYAAQFKATSPLQRASEITQPLLLAYGGADRRVPIKHGIDFRTAVLRTNKSVEWIEYPEEAHGWASVKNRVDFWRHVEQFLDHNIGADAKNDH